MGFTENKKIGGLGFKNFFKWLFEDIFPKLFKPKNDSLTTLK